ncbi:MAG TPA: class I SAM-dependent methyltransferase [Smithellaceae bacterium]|mgnify:CR=1 FL=1|nr:class I SAM-dependent methyltransferase [Smithellaceae bacterium]HRS81986.1 class I SAM-dependent methyltransferase [Smithellaceae bacterium]HRV44288.1 class I SAM-dependent methyltransferase [Smithellaceae bacterium]
MADALDDKKIREVFRDVLNHREMERIIRRCSTNPDDIRRKALHPVDLTSCRNVLELGCAFGSFTGALKGRLHPQAFITGLDIIPEYKPFFLKACEKAGYPGRFSSDGVHQIAGLPPCGVDLVLCSFALYFFVEVLPDIARILKPDGLFITITHASGNMRELIDIIRSILRSRRIIEPNDILPIEEILNAFSAENGESLLAPHFGGILKIDFPNTLVFPPQEIGAFIDYYRFKRPFFLAGTPPHADLILPDLTRTMTCMAAERRTVSMCKDDAIFICSQPRSSKEGP